MAKVDDDSWQKEFFEMKAYSSSEIKLLKEGAKGFKNAWCLGSFHDGYKTLKKKQEGQQL